MKMTKIEKIVICILGVSSIFFFTLFGVIIYNIFEHLK